MKVEKEDLIKDVLVNGKVTIVAMACVLLLSVAGYAGMGYMHNTSMEKLEAAMDKLEVAYGGGDYNRLKKDAWEWVNVNDGHLRTLSDATTDAIGNNELVGASQKKLIEARRGLYNHSQRFRSGLAGVE